MPIGVGATTVTVKDCVTPLSVAVIVAVPGDSPVTVPIASTLAMFGLVEDHCTWVVRFWGGPLE